MDTEMENTEVIWSDKQYITTHVRKVVSIWHGQIFISVGIIADIEKLYDHCNIGFIPSGNILVIHFCENGGYTVAKSTRGKAKTVNCQRAFRQFGLVPKDLKRHSYHAEVQLNDDIFIFLNEEVTPYFGEKQNG
jgi:hypothetical protein